MNSRSSLYIVVWLTLLACQSGDEMVETPKSPMAMESTRGSVYIGCEMAPYHIVLDSMMQCTSAMPLDSLLASSWMPPCQMSDLSIAEELADLSVWRNETGLELTVSDSTFDLEPMSLSMVMDSLSLVGSIYYGAYELSRETEVIQLVLFNRYIGGCFHDEIVWQRIE